MKIYAFLTALLLTSLLSSISLAAIEGQVTDSDGNPILRAWIYPVNEGSGTYSDSRGRFILGTIDPPVMLGIFHKNYDPAEVEVLVATSQPIQISLSARRGLREEITVTARVPRTDFSAVGAAATRIEPGEIESPVDTLVEIVESVPGIAENGQGGHLKVFSIRGVSGHRVRTSIGGVRLAGERRAGVSASFFDPFLIGSVELTRGPSVIRHGSGALGGVVEILPRKFAGYDVSLGYNSQGNENFFLGGWGKDGWSVGFTRRDADNASAPNGIELNTHFTQYSGLFSRSWDTGERESQLFVIPTLAHDIGKSSSDFPQRTTVYPRERHLLIGFSTFSSSLWRLEAFLHPHDLQTQVSDTGGLKKILTNSADFGATTTKQLFLGSRYILNLGADYFARRGVDSKEEAQDNTLRSLENGQEDELGLSASLSVQLRRAVLEGGSRLTWFRQSNQQANGKMDSALSGFAGVSVPLTLGVELTGSAGSGLRFPSLSERFFTGTTGRGTVLGNPTLDPERSLNTDIGIKLESGKVFAAGYYFHNRISDYIEQVDLQEDQYSFQNLTRGAIRGFEWETALAPAEETSLYFRGHLLRGRSAEGKPLSDIPTHRFSVGFRRQETRTVHYGSEWQLRSSKDGPGDGEKRIGSADLLSAFLSLRPLPTLRFSIIFTNLLNDLYFPTADKKAAFAPGRGITIRLTWLPG